MLPLPLPKGKINLEVNPMENKVSPIPEFKRYYLSEFELYDGEEFITFNIVAIDAMKKEIQVAVTNRGKLNLITYDLFKDDNGRLYFEYGVVLERIYLDNFAEVA